MEQNPEENPKINYFNYFIRAVIFSYLYSVRISIEIPNLKVEGLISGTMIAISSFLTIILEFLYLTFASVISTSLAESITSALEEPISEDNQEDSCEMHTSGHTEIE